MQTSEEKKPINQGTAKQEKKGRVLRGKMKKSEERKEALMRIFVWIVSGIILTVWRFFIYLLVLVNLIYTVFMGKRLKDLAEMGEIWNTQWYIFQRYILFVSNKRPFPFEKLERKMSKYESGRNKR